MLLRLRAADSLCLAGSCPAVGEREKEVCGGEMEGEKRR